MQIPADILAEIRSRARIEDVVGRSVQLQKKGGRYWGLCPFHQEKSPSFSVSSEKQLFHCFGCHAGGDVFNFLERLEGLDFIQAVKHLAAELQIELPQSKVDTSDESKRNKLGAINEIATEFFRQQLTQEPRAQAYLRDQRGLGPEIIAEFRVGWAPEGWQALLETLKRQNIDPRQALALGLIGENTSSGRQYDRFRGRVIFPILHQGRVVGFGARRADWIDAEGPKYLNSPESTLYDKSAVLFGLDQAKSEIRKTHRALLVEGYLDVLALVQAGFKNVVATCGTSATERHATALAKICREVFVLYDGDDAGRAAMQKAAILLLSHDLEVKIIDLPDGEDPDSYVRRSGKEALQARIEGAPQVIDYFLAKLATQARGGGVAGLTDAIHQLKPYLAAIKDPLRRDLALTRISEHFRVPNDVLRRHLRGETTATTRTPQPNKPSQLSQKPKESLIPTLEIALLKMLFEDPAKVIAELTRQNAQTAFSHPGVAKAVETAAVMFAQGASLDPPRALEIIREAAELAPDGPALQSLRRGLIESLPEQNNLTECVTRLLERHRRTALRQLVQRLEQEVDQDRAAAIAEEARELILPGGPTANSTT